MQPSSPCVLVFDSPTHSLSNVSKLRNKKPSSSCVLGFDSPSLANDLNSTCWGSIPRHLPTSSNVPKLRKGTIIITMIVFYCVHNNYIGIVKFIIICTKEILMIFYYHLYKRNINDLGHSFEYFPSPCKLDFSSIGDKNLLIW